MDCLQYFAVMNNAAVNELEHVPFHASMYICSIGISGVNALVILIHNAKVPSMLVILFCTASRMYEFFF